MRSFYIWFPLLVTLVIGLAVAIFEGALRRSTNRKSSKESTDDKGTTTGVAVAFVVCWLAILLSILLNRLGIGTINPHWILNVIGGALMLAGIFVRVVSARTLGRFYSRTLTTENDQHLVTSGLYGFVRHPGYLGTITLFIGSGIAVDNLITILLVLVVILPAYARRINVEERMLEKVFGQEFTQYRARTRKLIPLVF